MSTEHGGHGGGGSIEFAHASSVIESILGILTFAFILKYATGNPHHGEGGGEHH